MQRRDGLLTLCLRLVSNVAGVLKNGVSKSVSKRALHYLIDSESTLARRSSR